MGSLSMRVFTAGHLEMDLDMLISYHPNHVLTRSQRERERTWYRCPCFAFVIDSPDGRILLDTAISPNWEQEWRHPVWNELTPVVMGPEEALEARLRQLGMSPEDFRYVVVTHLHSDHAGNLRLFQDAGAEIIVHEDEIKGALSMERDPNRLWGPGSGFGFMYRDFAFLPRRATTVYGDQELVRGVRLLSVPGHTWGTLAVMVNLERSGRLVYASDALYHHESYGPPAVGSVTTILPEAWPRSVEKLRRLAHRTDAAIIPGHSTTTLEHRQGEVSFGEVRLAPGHTYE